jgi:hypothetical protein
MRLTRWLGFTLRGGGEEKAGDGKHARSRQLRETCNYEASTRKAAPARRAAQGCFVRAVSTVKRNEPFKKLVVEILSADQP